MSASGQMPSDYGEHWTPEAVWPDYGACGCLMIVPDRIRTVGP